MGRSCIRFRNAVLVSDRRTVKSVGNSSDRKQKENGLPFMEKGEMNDGKN